MLGLHLAKMVLKVLPTVCERERGGGQGRYWHSLFSDVCFDALQVLTQGPVLEHYLESSMLETGGTQINLVLSSPSSRVSRAVTRDFSGKLSLPESFWKNAASLLGFSVESPCALEHQRL